MSVPKARFKVFIDVENDLTFNTIGRVSFEEDFGPELSISQLEELNEYLIDYINLCKTQETT